LPRRRPEKGSSLLDTGYDPFVGERARDERAGVDRSNTGPDDSQEIVSKILRRNGSV
jgi:hypothetical protein